jgi:drug/metabolite transporter (DMT)-like permease
VLDMTRTGHGSDGRASPALIWSALWAVYIIWGTTYLAIRVSNETLPPLIAAGVRFLVAGAVLYAITARRGDVRGDRPGRAQWGAAAIVGIALVAGGNGLVVLAERTIPSGIAALIIALVPLWMALVDRVLLRHRVGGLTVLGLVLGFGGAALLIGGRLSTRPRRCRACSCASARPSRGRADRSTRATPRSRSGRSSAPAWR